MFLNCFILLASASIYYSVKNLQMIDAETVKSNINKRFDGLFYKHESGEVKPFVCIFCDEFLKPAEVEIISLEKLAAAHSVLTPSAWNAVSPDVMSYYTFKDECIEGSRNPQWMNDMLLSSRSSFMKFADRRKKNGFSTCRKCKHSLDCREMPRYAIANNYSFGTPPPCLLCLTEVELALLTPVKTYGYCFSFSGGCHKQLKGSLTYYKVDVESIVRAAMHLDVLEMHNNIVILLHGKMTPYQKQTAKRRCRVRVNRILDALVWLLANNEQWKQRNIDLDEVRDKLKSPVIIDNSSVDIEGDSNIESTESFKVFFPDGTMSETNGGQANLEKFKSLVRELKEQGQDLDFQCDLSKEIAADFKDSNLVNACLLQFPYGRGGIHEMRKKGDGSISDKTHIEDYVEHLTRLSQPHFHRELFTLILYNMNMKQSMVRSACWKVREKGNATAFSQELTSAEVNSALDGRARGQRNYNSTGSKFVGAIDAVARSVPHTNEASRKGRRDAEAMQHHFGLPHLFLTYTGDDQNSFLVQVYSEHEIDDDTPVRNLSDEELARRSKLRNELRISYPGICAYFYECMLEIVIEEVIGWDLRTNEARRGGGLFGIPIAFTSSTEEQGRMTLHSHFLIWLKNFQARRAKLDSENSRERQAANIDLCAFVDKISSCSLIDPAKLGCGKLKDVFPHECSVVQRKRKLPAIVDDQSLRYLRHEFGDQFLKGRFADCMHCSHSWTNAELVESYLIHGAKIDGLRNYPDKCHRLKAMAVEYQKSNSLNEVPLPEVIEAGYSHHIHAGQMCFGKSEGKKRKGEKRRMNNRECRYRYPQAKRRKTSIENVGETPMKWFGWDGSFTNIHVKEVLIKRHAYDAFQNVSCPAISQSKLSCNTNIALLMPGPVGQYTFKYNIKQTQKDDTEEYERVKESTEKTISKLKKDASDSSVSIQRVLAASFAHQKTNVVGGAMSAYLTRNKKRFIFSHEMVWCPLRDIKALLAGKRVNTMLSQNFDSTFYICSAMNYLCRPLELEDLNAHDFYSLYEVKQLNAKNGDSMLNFSNANYVHPSFQASKGLFRQGVRPRSHRLLPKVLQYDFPDSAQFGGSIFDSETMITKPMETYSELVLLLFTPYRTLDDMQDESGSYTRKLREVHRLGKLQEESMNFLQNIQDAKANCFRAGKPEDKLQRTTEPFMPADSASDRHNTPEEEDIDNQPDIEGPALDELLQLVGEGPDGNEEDDIQECGLPKSLNLRPMRHKGVYGAGYEHIAKMQSNPEAHTRAYQATDNTFMAQEAGADDNAEELPQQPPKKKDLVSILRTKNNRRTYSFADIIKNSKPVSLLEANGSVHSIIDWAKKANLDREQRRAFEIFVGTFVLSFYDDTATEVGQSTARTLFKKEHKRLKRLVEVSKRGSQLVCLLHGPGGCGKTTVIDLVVAYSKEYCSYMDNFTFDARTIVVTAMTGVAATLLLGETTHRALYLNQRRPIDAEQICVWQGTRLLIIDEISFASKEDFSLIHRRMQTLKQKLDGVYGGLDIIFAGDFRQLEPVGKHKQPVYTENCPEFKDWTNCFIELKGMHRFKDDPQHGRRLLRFRDGTVTKEDIAHINKRVVKNDTELPDDIRYATYFNRDRDSINAALFEERCKDMYGRIGNTDDTIMIFSDKLRKKIGEKTFTKLKRRKHFWENCGEDHCKPGSFQPRMDPVLRLYTGCRVLLPENDDVSEGRANGTQAFFEKAVLKAGIRPRQVLVDGVPVNAVFASEVQHVVLNHANNRIQPQKFSIEPKLHRFKAQLLLPEGLQHKSKKRESITMTAFQVPMLVNNATTGHKLQGSGVDNVFIHRWSYVQNWPYVMLSRVKTEEGLFMRGPLRRDLSTYAVPKSLQRMMKAFEKRAPSYWNEATYRRMFGTP